MRTDTGQDDRQQGVTADAPDPNHPPVWKFGSRIAAWNVAAARKAYVRYAEVAERALNEVDATTSKVSKDVLAVANTARRTLDQLHGREASVHHARPRRGTGRASSNVKAKVERGRADLRDIAFRGQIAADTNVRAYLDHLDDLAKAPSAQHIVSAHTTFVLDQWQRSLQQAFDLQQRTVGALRTITSSPKT